MHPSESLEQPDWEAILIRLAAAVGGVESSGLVETLQLLYPVSAPSGVLVSVEDASAVVIWDGPDVNVAVSTKALQELDRDVRSALEADSFKPAELRGRRYGRIADSVGIPEAVVRAYANILNGEMLCS